MNITSFFEKPSDGNVFKDSLKSEDCILILKRCMENIEKKNGKILHCNKKHKRKTD